MTNKRLLDATAEAFPPQRRGIGKRKAVIDYEQVRQLTEQGQSCTAIAETLGCSRSAIHNIRRRLGITNPTQRQLTPEKRAAIEAAIQDGWSQAEICRTHHVDPETMRRHYPQAKWDRQQQNEHIRTIRAAHRFNWGHQQTEAESRKVA
jgi:DNA invertase Pin-like site-specific DNA recombinase